MSLDLFSQPTEAQRLATTGMDRARDRADRLSGGTWSEAAFQYLLEWMRDHAEFYCSQVADSAKENAKLPEGAIGQAWGGIIQRAIREGRIESSGRHVKTYREKSHNRKEEVWRVVHLQRA